MKVEEVSMIRCLSFSLILAFVFVPWLIHGGFVVDDWNFCYLGMKGMTLSEHLKTMLHSAATRPLAAIALVFPGRFFTEYPILYASLNLVLMLLSGFIFARPVREHLGERSGWLFLAFFSFPVMASSSVWIKCSGFIIALSGIIWGLSLNVLLGSEDNRYGRILFSSVLVYLSLMVYEVFFPLIVFNVFMAGRVLGAQKLDLATLRKCTWMVGIFFGALLAAHLSKSYFQSLFPGDYYRLNPTGMAVVIYNFFRFYFALLVEFPVLSCLGACRLFNEGQIAIVLVCGALTCFFFSILPESKNTTSRNFVPLILCSGAFVLTSLIFALSGYPPLLEGSFNRLFPPAWVTVSVLLAFLGRDGKNTLWKIMLGVALFLFVTFFVAQRNSFVEACREQVRILYDFKEKVLAEDVGPQDLIIANVPRVTTSDFSSEVVFDGIWDFGAGGQLFCLDKIKPPFPVFSADTELFPENSPPGWIYLGCGVLEKFKSHVWYYEYDQKTGNSLFKKTISVHELKSLYNEAKRKQINPAPQTFIMDIRQKMRTLF